MKKKDAGLSSLVELVEGRDAEIARDSIFGGRGGFDRMRDRRVLIGGLIAGDGADVAALMIDVNLAGGRVRQQVPLIGRRRIWIGRHIDDRRRGRSGGRRRGRARRNRQRQDQGNGCRNLSIHDAAKIGWRRTQISSCRL